MYSFLFKIALIILATPATSGQVGPKDNFLTLAGCVPEKKQLTGKTLHHKFSPFLLNLIKFITYAVERATSTMYAIEYFTDGGFNRKQVTYSLLCDMVAKSLFAPGSIVNLCGPNIEKFIVLPDGIVIIYYY